MPPAPAAPGQLPDPRVQAPLEIGDYINFSGILVTDNADPTTGPWPGIAGTYVSAHTIVANTAIYTTQGTDPAYVMIEVTLLGAGGLGGAEAALRTRFEGMTTDPSRIIHLYAIDLDPATAASTDRDLGTIAPDTTVFVGRWRFRPPCAAFGGVPTDKTCVMNHAGTFLPPTREVRAVIEGQQGQVPGTATAQTAANGLFFGQYHAPILEYVFPENAPGAPIVPNNFESFPFLACGGFTSSAGTLAGPLEPWPGTTAPTCANTVILSATSSVVSPTVSLTLQPYVTASGTTFDPAIIGNTFTNAGGGLYSLTVAGVPQPAAPPARPLTARSSAGGVSPPHGIDQLR